MVRPNIFISYSHRDERILRSLLPYLESLQRQNVAEIWNDTELKGGGRWCEETSRPNQGAGSFSP
jgi:hypothetical protein